jgi:ketosteroid isomerase-like protein
VSARKEVVETYLEGFRRSDHEQILACLTDDVAWDLPGHAHLTGKDAFDREIEDEEFVGSPTLTVDRLIEEADTVVAIGNGETTHRSGEVHRFAFCDVFTFAGAGCAGSSRTSFGSGDSVPRPVQLLNRSTQASS